MADEFLALMRTLVAKVLAVRPLVTLENSKNREGVTGLLMVQGLGFKV